MNLKSIAQIEYYKLFRRSNILFLFLCVYLFVTPIARGYDNLKTIENAGIEQLYIAIVNSFAVMGLLFTAIFVVNSTGNEFTEGSYNKLRGMGLSIQDYFKGKLLLILLLNFFIVISILIVYFSFSPFFVKAGGFEIICGIKWAGIVNQLLSLFSAALFGLFFITVFRSRTIGLVFFPFWFFTEFIVLLLDRSGYQRLYADFFPGISSYELFVNPNFDISSMSVVIIYITVFATSSWYGLVLRR
jgi:hypothetical protein